MLSSLTFFTLLGLGLFVLHELLLYPQVYIRPLAPLLFYVSLRDSLPLAFTLAVLLGLLEDSFALAPYGVHLISSLILVAVARLARQTFLVKNTAFLVLAMLVTLVLQELGVRLILAILGSWEVFFVDMSWPRFWEIIVTAGLTPVFFSLIRALENQWRRLGRPRRQAPATW